MYDLVIHSARVVDGTGAPEFQGTVAVCDGRIVDVGADLGAVQAREVVSGEHLVLSPGFIDVHAHDDFAVLYDPEVPWKVLQGVTTEVVGNCGIGVAPFPGAEDWWKKLHPGAKAPKHRDYAGYFEQLELQPPSLNVAVLAGHGALRNAAAPGARRSLDDREFLRLEAELDSALQAGVCGLSAGLIYEPGVFANEEEMVRLLRRARAYAPLFCVHLRSEADELLDAVHEAIRISRQAGVGLQLSHHKAHGRNNWGKVRRSLELVDEAHAQGLDVWLDQYPYTAGSTILQAVIDRGGLGGGPALGELEPGDIVVASSSVSPAWEGKSLAELAREMRLSPQETAESILCTDPGVWVVVFAMSEDDVRTVLSHPLTLVGSDGLPTRGGRPHPRLFGTFPRILGHYVRNEHLLSMREAIAKMTGRAAARFGLADRGTIERGKWADLVLFDDSAIDSASTYQEPARSPLGIMGVWVNGQRVVTSGRHTGKRPGMPLRRVTH